MVCVRPYPEEAEVGVEGKKSCLIPSLYLTVSKLEPREYDHVRYYCTSLHYSFSLPVRNRHLPWFHLPSALTFYWKSCRRFMRSGIDTMVPQQ